MTEPTNDEDEIIKRKGKARDLKTQLWRNTSESLKAPRCCTDIVSTLTALLDDQGHDQEDPNSALVP